MRRAEPSQKVFNRGALRLCKGLERKIFIYSASYFNLEGLKLHLGGLIPPKPSRGDETGEDTSQETESPVPNTLGECFLSRWHFVVVFCSYSLTRFMF